MLTSLKKVSSLVNNWWTKYKGEYKINTSDYTFSYFMQYNDGGGGTRTIAFGESYIVDPLTGMVTLQGKTYNVTVSGRANAGYVGIANTDGTNSQAIISISAPYRAGTMYSDSTTYNELANYYTFGNDKLSMAYTNNFTIYTVGADGLYCSVNAQSGDSSGAHDFGTGLITGNNGTQIILSDLSLFISELSSTNASAFKHSEYDTDGAYYSYISSVISDPRILSRTLTGSFVSPGGIIDILTIPTIVVLFSALVIIIIHMPSGFAIKIAAGVHPEIVSLSTIITNNKIQLLTDGLFPDGTTVYFIEYIL